MGDGGIEDMGLYLAGHRHVNLSNVNEYGGLLNLVSASWKFLTTKGKKFNFGLQTASEIKSNLRFEIYGSNST